MFDPEMRISHIGPRLQSLFNENMSVIGKHISDIFTVLRPDILHIEWAKVDIFVCHQFLFYSLLFSSLLRICSFLITENQ